MGLSASSLYLPKVGRRRKVRSHTPQELAYPHSCGHRVGSQVCLPCSGERPNGTARATVCSLSSCPRHRDKCSCCGCLRFAATNQTDLSQEVAAPCTVGNLKVSPGLHTSDAAAPRNQCFLDRLVALRHNWGGRAPSLMTQSPATECKAI